MSKLNFLQPRTSTLQRFKKSCSSVICGLVKSNWAALSSRPESSARSSHITPLYSLTFRTKSWTRATGAYSKNRRLTRVKKSPKHSRSLNQNPSACSLTPFVDVPRKAAQNPPRSTASRGHSISNTWNQTKRRRSAAPPSGRPKIHWGWRSFWAYYADRSPYSPSTFKTLAFRPTKSPTAGFQRLVKSFKARSIAISLTTHTRSPAPSPS